jgi:hypothetical protein
MELAATITLYMALLGNQMNATRRAQSFAGARTNVRLRELPVHEERAAYWWINGYRAKLLIWTLDEWENMKNLPSDAQFHPSGVWCALRIE